MARIYTLLGKSHRIGTSRKTGQPYDIYFCHFCFTDPDEVDEGQGVEAVTLNYQTVQHSGVSLDVGASYYLLRNSQGRVTDFLPA